MKKLRDVETPLANFFASGVLALRRQARPDPVAAAAELGFDAGPAGRVLRRSCRARPARRPGWPRRHDERMTGRALTDDATPTGRCGTPSRCGTPASRPPAFTELLREHDIAVVVADTAGKWPLIREVTADFAYLRLHGDKELYASGYSDEALRGWAADDHRLGRRAAATCSSTSTTT